MKRWKNALASLGLALSLPVFAGSGLEFEARAPFTWAYPLSGATKTAEEPREPVDPVRLESAQGTIVRVQWACHQTENLTNCRSTEEVVSRFTVLQRVYDIRDLDPNGPPRAIEGSRVEMRSVDENNRTLRLQVNLASVIFRSRDPGLAPGHDLRGFYASYYIDDGEGGLPPGVRDGQRQSGASAFTKDLESPGILLSADTWPHFRSGSSESFVTFRVNIEFSKVAPTRKSTP